MVCLTVEIPSILNFWWIKNWLSPLRFMIGRKPPDLLAIKNMLLVKPGPWVALTTTPFPIREVTSCLQHSNCWASIVALGCTKDWTGSERNSSRNHSITVDKTHGSSVSLDHSDAKRAICPPNEPGKTREVGTYRFEFWWCWPPEDDAPCWLLEPCWLLLGRWPLLLDDELDDPPLWRPPLAWLRAFSVFTCSTRAWVNLGPKRWSPSVGRMDFSQNVATAGGGDVVVQDGPELQGCTDCTFFGWRLLVLLDAACEEQERFGKVQHLKCLVAVNLLKRVDISLGRWRWLQVFEPEVESLIEWWVGQKASRSLELWLESLSGDLGTRFA